MTPRPIVAAALAALLLSSTAPASAGLTDRWIAVGAVTGVERPDGTLADYQWDTAPQAAWGATALAGIGPLAAGVRVWTTRTTQRLDASTATRVRATSVELTARGRIAGAFGIDLLAVASGGRMHLGYDPDQVTIDTGGGGPVTVDLAPIDTWVAGGGLALTRALAAGWTAGLEVDHRVFALDTAHREGNTIVSERETFGDWSARFEIARRFALR